MYFKLLLASFLFLTSCSKNNGSPNTGDAVKILFVGNSLTYVNDLPQMVRDLGTRDGRTIEISAIVAGNYSLEDHWNEGKVQDAIQKGGFDFVVAQQGPSALPESQVLLLEYATRFAGVCNAAQTKLALYMVWPSKARLFDLDGVIFSYTNAATKTGSLLCPAGLAWKKMWQQPSPPLLYGPDEFHPGIDGSLLAALTIYGRLFNKTNFDFIEHKDFNWKLAVNEAMLNRMKATAIEALQ